MSDLPPLPTIALGRWRHHKGGRYEVLGVVRHSETLEPLVLYRPLAGDTGTWVRPFAMFQETVVHDGRVVPRFEPEVADARIPAATPAAASPPRHRPDTA